MSIIDISSLYRIFIDPVLSPSHEIVKSIIGKNKKIIDIACGTGSLVFKLAPNAKYIIGIDLSVPMIKQAIKIRHKLSFNNTKFLVHDALKLDSVIKEKYNYATLSMAVHQFPMETGLNILNKLKIHVNQIIIFDYNFKMKSNILKKIVYIMERIAGKEHYENFKYYMNTGGLPAILKKLQLKIDKKIITGNGVFTIIKVKT